MPPVLLEPPLRRFQCPSCRAFASKRDPRVTSELHSCPAEAGLMVPLVELAAGQTELAAGQVRHVQVEREDYIGAENAGRIMAVRTERADGSNDCTVYAPTATARAEDFR